MSLLALCLCVVAVAASRPEQVHISYGYQPSQMVVMWSTAELGGSQVVYGPHSTQLNRTVIGTCWKFTEGNPDGLQYMHRVQLEVRRLHAPVAGANPRFLILKVTLPRIFTGFDSGSGVLVLCEEPGEHQLCVSIQSNDQRAGNATVFLKSSFTSAPPIYIVMTMICCLMKSTKCKPSTQFC